LRGPECTNLVVIAAMISGPFSRVLHRTLPTNLFGKEVVNDLLKKLCCIRPRKWPARPRRNDLGLCTMTGHGGFYNAGDISFAEDMAGMYGASVTRHSNKIGLSEEALFLEETLEPRRGPADANAVGSN